MGAGSKRLPSSAWVLLAKAAASAAVLAAGFDAVSDDDYARVVIAERFAHAPDLDPSGTSWLPFPFWLTGTAMLIAGRTLAVARLAAVASGMIAAWLGHRAALWLGYTRSGALVGGLGAALLPHAVVLGVATVPEALTAGCILLALGALGSPTASRRLTAASLLTAATLSRYEAWPVAAVFAGFQLYDATRPALTSARRGALLGAGALALAGPLGWVLHGALTHGDPLFFLARVAAYRQALRGADAATVGSWLGYPRALLVEEPELAAGVVALLWVGVGRGRVSSVERRALLSMASLLAFLIAGDIADGAPTHHPGRPLLVIWLLCALMAGERLARAWGQSDSRRRRHIALALGVAVIVGALSRRLIGRDSFADRGDEVGIGGLARSRVEPGQTVAIDTEDYGYFAITAAFGRPEDALVVRDHDPRHRHDPTPRCLPTASVRRSQGCAELVAKGARWLITKDGGGAFVIAPLTER